MREYIVQDDDKKHPTVVRRLVRCKDCIHYRYYGLSEDTVSECTIDHTESPDENWFCADGAGKDDE